MGLTAGKIPKAASADHIIDGYDALTAVGTPGVDTAVVTDKAVRDALNLKAGILHASNHVDGTDDIQDATAAQKGLATATQITKLNGIEALADVTDSTNVASAGAVMQSLATAKGDILVATGANALSRLAVGANNESLIADSSQPSGMKWGTTPSVQKTVVLPIDRLNVYGNYAVETVNSNGNINFTFNIPEDFTSLVSLEVVCIPEASITAASIWFDSNYGAIGENYNTHSESDHTSTFTASVDVISSFDISSVFGSVSAGDKCGILITHKTIGTSINYMFISLTYLN